VRRTYIKKVYKSEAENKLFSYYLHPLLIRAFASPANISPPAGGSFQSPNFFGRIILGEYL
jgi:hypothetical protein